jgi:hypothetical protein
MHQSTIFQLYTSIITVLLIRQAEDDNRGENLVFLNEKWFNSNDLKDSEEEFSLRNNGIGLKLVFLHKGKPFRKAVSRS